MLRLVHPKRGGQETRPSKGRKSPALSPSAAESDRIRAAIRSLARAYGGYDCLAAVMGLRPGFLLHIVGGAQNASFAAAVLTARAAGISLEQLLAPGVKDAGRCAVCGRKAAQ